MPTRFTAASFRLHIFQTRDIRHQADILLRKLEPMEKFSVFFCAMKCLGRETLNGSPPQHTFAAMGALRAVRCDTGEIMAVDNLTGKDPVGGSAFAKEASVREAIDKVASPKGNPESIPTILSKILARWVTETDLGAMKRLEFTGISSDDFQKIQTDFTDTEKVSAVWPREFDSQGISVLDVETRLDNIALGQEVVKATSGRTKLDRATENLISFKVAPSNR
jgi:hypothetical protein